jgi:hypothetical protein
VIDNDQYGKTLTCGSKAGEYSLTPVLVEKEIKVQFDTSDMTWLIFVSEPMEFVCTNKEVDEAAVSNLPPGVVTNIYPFFTIDHLTPLFYEDPASDGCE